MARSSEKPKGVHRVKKLLADGSRREYHYVFRGGPKFWDSTSDAKPGDAAYTCALADALRGVSHKPAISKHGLTSDVLANFRASAQFVNLAPRTQSDYEKFLVPFEAEFGEDPIKLFEETESLAEIRIWKNRWSKSPKQYDYATTVVTRFLNWAKEEDAAISLHHHSNMKRLYKSDRSDIIWLPDELNSMLAVSSELEARVIIAASEGGLTPQDIGILTRDHVQKTTGGRRLFFRRQKTNKLTSIPVTPALGRLIDATPEDQKYLVVSIEGRRLKAERAAQIVRDVKVRANEAAAADRSLNRVRDELRLYDMRGTAATELLRAGCSLNEIAVTMGWGLRHAANIIEKYAAVVPDVADEVLAKLTIARKRVQQDP